MAVGENKKDIEDIEITELHIDGLTLEGEPEPSSDGYVQQRSTAAITELVLGGGRGSKQKKGKEKKRKAQKENPESEKEKSKGRGGRRFILVAGILVILTGLGFISYPIISQKIAAYKQDLIMEETEKVIEKAIEQQLMSENGSEPEEVVGSTVAETDNPVGSSDIAIDTPDIAPYDYIAEQFMGLALENESSSENQVLESDRLNGQKLFGIIKIEKIDLVYALVEGTEKWNIGVAIGHFEGTAGIGEEGNCALAGHRGGTSGPYFKDIDQLASGDKVLMKDLKGNEYTYVVYESFVVEPLDTYVIEPLETGGRVLTLVTCTDNGTKRLVVRASIES